MVGKPLSYLEEIYGDGAVAQQARYQTAIKAFAAIYGPGPVAIYRVPGRVNLIGEHTDYQQGYVLPVALDKDLLFLARRRRDASVVLHNAETAQFPPRQFGIRRDISADPAGDWSNYARGAAQMLARIAERPLHGMDVLVVGEAPYGVPRGAGLSSSSALTVGVALVLSSLNDLHIAPAELAWLCGEAEWYVGTRGGIMDQFIALLGKRNHALFLDCRAQPGPPGSAPRFHTEQVPLPKGYNIIVIDSKVRHQNVRSDFNVRVAEGRIGVALLQRRLHADYPGQITHLRDLERYPWSEIEPFLPEALTHEELNRLSLRLADLIDVALPDTVERFRVQARCRHVVSENVRVRQSVAALRASDIRRFGALLNEAHASVRDDYEASCPELEILVRLAREVDGVIGARMTGAGWGGCLIALARKGCENAFTSQVTKGYHAETGLWPDVFVCRAGNGAGLVSEEAITHRT